MSLPSLPSTPSQHSRSRFRPPRWLASGIGGLIASLVLVAAVVAPVAAVVRVGLGTASSYAILAGSTVTNTGPSVINGDLGVSPGTAITGFPPGIVNGEIHAADAVAGVAKDDLTTAYNDAAGQPTDVTVTADLAGQTLVPGVYTGDTLALNGQLTLDGANETDPVFIFQSSSTLITGSASSINFINGASACDVYWQVGSSATIGTGSAFAGTVLALTSITADTGATVQGRLLARNGAVTLDTNTISVPSCSDATPTTPEPTTPAPTSPAPTSPAPTSPAPTTPGPTSPAPTTSGPTPGGPTGGEPTAGGPGPAAPGPGGPGPAQPGDGPGGDGPGSDGPGGDGPGGDDGGDDGPSPGGNAGGPQGNAPGGQDGGQISPLPVGGVQTGGSPAAGTVDPWWVSGALLALLSVAGLFVVRRGRNPHGG